MKIAVFPGSFDPITLGHAELVKRASPLFDKIIIAIGENSAKNTLFTFDQRLQFIRATFQDFPNIEIDSYQGLTVHYCKKVGAQFILRGLRSSPDFEYERSIAQLNAQLEGIETLFLISDPKLSPVSSSLVREIIKNEGSPIGLVPEVIIPLIQSAQHNR